MKFIISTFLALAIAVPVTVVKAFPLEIAIESSINRGLMKVFPDGDYVKLQFYNGQDPQSIGYLHFKEPGMQRFDIVDDRKLGQKTQNQYNNCYVSVLKAPALGSGEQIVISVKGTLDHHIPTAEGYEDKVHIKCKWTDNGKQ